MFLFNNFGFTLYNSSFSGYSEKNVSSVSSRSSGLLTRLSEAVNRFFDWVANCFSSKPSGLEGRAVVIEPRLIAEPAAPVEVLPAPDPVLEAVAQAPVEVLPAPEPALVIDSNSTSKLLSIATGSVSQVVYRSASLAHSAAKNVFSYAASFFVNPDNNAALSKPAEAPPAVSAPLLKVEGEDDQEESAVSISESSQNEEDAYVEVDNDSAPIVPAIPQANKEQKEALKETLDILSTLSLWSIGRKIGRLKALDNTLNSLLREPLSLFLVVVSDKENTENFRKVFNDTGKIGSEFTRKMKAKLEAVGRETIARQLVEFCQITNYQGFVPDLKALALDGDWSQLISKILSSS